MLACIYNPFMTTATTPSSLPTTQLTWHSRVIRQLKRLAVLLTIIYLLILIGGCMFQEKLLFPGAWITLSHATPAAAVVSPPVETLTLHTADGQTVSALFAPAHRPLYSSSGLLHPVTCPTILYFYGNAMCLDDNAWEIETFRKLPANVLVTEYVGYPRASGKPSEAGCYASAEAAYQWALRDPRINKKRLVAMGWSLGAAVACDLAWRHPLVLQAEDDPGISGLVMCSAFTSIDDVAAHHYWFLPTQLMLRHHFRSRDKIGTIKCPILLVHGTVDNIVPYPMSLTLRDAIRKAGTTEVTHLPIPGASHNDLYLEGAPELVPALRTFLRPRD